MPTTARVETVGLDKAMDRYAAYNRSRAKDVLDRAALAMANVSKRWVEEKMVEPKSGKVYPHLETQPSSAPGEVPAIQSENLVTSLNTRNEDSGSPTVGRAVFGAGAEDQFGFPYALALEFGYGDLAARPFMRPSVDDNHDEIAQAALDVVNAAWQQENARVGK